MLQSEKSNGKPCPILVPTDFSANSVPALVWAADAAHHLKAPLVVLHVVHDPASAPGYYHKGGKKGLRRMEETAAEMMEKFLERLRGKHPGHQALQDAESKLVIGLPVTRILEVAEQLDAQLMVVGSHGRTGLPHLLLGSKAERLARLSPIPVTVVKAEKPNQG